MHTPRHPTRSITIMASALLALFLLSFVLGRYGVPLGEVVKILLSRVFPIEQTWTARPPVPASVRRWRS